MIQRIQTVYLLLVAVLMGITAISPLLLLNTSEGGLLDLCSCGIYNGKTLVKPIYGIVSMAGISVLLVFLNIFLFKKRKLQTKVGHLTSLLIISFYITVAAYFSAFTSANGAAFSGIHYGILLPVAALVLNVLAICKIKSDEKLVRSLDRIR